VAAGVAFIPLSILRFGGSFLTFPDSLRGFSQQSGAAAATWQIASLRAIWQFRLRGSAPCGILAAP
jgi:hypothetical protein